MKKLPDEVVLAAITLCGIQGVKFQCSQCPIDMGKQCEAHRTPLARRILAKWRKERK